MERQRVFRHARLAFDDAELDRGEARPGPWTPARHCGKLSGLVAVVKVPALGQEWIVDAFGCSPALLGSRPTLERLFAAIVADLELTPIAEPIWHVFPGAGGITGLQVLSESHLACHTFPERGVGAFNLYCCRAALDWPWEARLREILRARVVSVRVLARGTGRAGARRVVPPPPPRSRSRRPHAN